MPRKEKIGFMWMCTCMSTLDRRAFLPREDLFMLMFVSNRVITDKVMASIGLEHSLIPHSLFSFLCNSPESISSCCFSLYYISYSQNKLGTTGHPSTFGRKKKSMSVIDNWANDPSGNWACVFRVYGSHYTRGAPRNIFKPTVKAFVSFKPSSAKTREAVSSRLCQQTLNSTKRCWHDLIFFFSFFFTVRWHG